MNININAHSSIKIMSDNVIYFDPFQIEKETHDADVIFITHSHYDHYSLEDINKVNKKDTIYIVPKSMSDDIDLENVIFVDPNEEYDVFEYHFKAIRAYNKDKEFHPFNNNWLGYLVNVESKIIYVAGDSEMTKDNENIKCDIALIPVGGKYTMDYKEASKLVNKIKPELAIPTHYGSIVGSKDDGLRFKELVDENIKVEILI